MKERKQIIQDCLRRPYKVVFTELGDYESLEYDFETENEAYEKLKELSDEAKNNNQPYFVEVLRRLIIRSEE